MRVSLFFPNGTFATLHSAPAWLTAHKAIMSRLEHQILHDGEICLHHDIVLPISLAKLLPSSDGPSHFSFSTIHATCDLAFCGGSYSRQMCILLEGRLVQLVQY